MTECQRLAMATSDTTVRQMVWISHGKGATWAERLAETRALIGPLPGELSGFRPTPGFQKMREAPTGSV